MMKRIAVLCCVALTMVATPARAQLACTDPDLVALVFDSGEINHTPTPLVPFNLHVVLLNPTAQSLDGFEFRLVMPSPTGELVVLQETLPPGAINLGMNQGSYRDFIVGLATPQLPGNGRIELVTLSLMSLGSTLNQDFLVQPTVPASIPGAMAYNEPVEGSGVLHAMAPFSGNHALPVARLFPSAPLAYCTVSSDYGIPLIDITTVAGSVSDPLARAGTHLRASNGFDAHLEQPLPALPPGNYVCTSFLHPDWPLGPRFEQDLRALYNPGLWMRSWPLLVETDRDDVVSLTFTPNFAAGDNLHPVLRDQTTNLMLPLFPHLTYSFRNRGLPTARRLDLEVGTTAVPAPSPAMSSVPAGWTLASLPFEPTAGSNTVGDVLLDPSPGYAFAYTYDPSIGYVAAAAGDPATPGTGYWLGTTAPYVWPYSGAKPFDGRVMPTRPGWNLIGYPNWTRGEPSRLIVRHGGDSMSWTAAAQAGLVSPDVQGYDPIGHVYYDAQTLLPFQAYWVNVLAGGVDVIVFWRNFQITEKAQTVAVAAPGKWRTDFVLCDAAGAVRTVTLGVDPLGSAGFDPLLDRPQPPSPPVPGPDFCLLHPEWQLACGSRFTRDVVGPAAGALSWPLTLTSPTAGPATLRWNTAGWPADLDLQLYLPAENRVLVPSLRAQSSVPVTLGNGPVTVVVRTPDATSGVGDLPAAADGDLTVHPNPFNPQATLSFTLPQAAVAEVRVYSLRGELVRVLGGSLLAAGPQHLVWDGADLRGRAMPSGTYFGRLVLDGAVSGGIVRMSLVR